MAQSGFPKPKINLQVGEDGRCKILQGARPTNGESHSAPDALADLYATSVSLWLNFYLRATERPRHLPITRTLQRGAVETSETNYVVTTIAQSI